MAKRSRKHNLADLRKQYYPDWSFKAQVRFLDTIKRMDHLLSVATHGAVAALKDPDAVRALEAGILGPRRPFEPFLAAGTDNPDAVVGELDENLRRLRGLLLVGAAAGLDDFVREAVIAYVARCSKAKGFPKVAALLDASPRPPGTTPDQHAAKLYDDALGACKSRHRAQGVSRIECVLEAFDLGGSLDEDVRSAMDDLYAVRHSFAHGRGISDARFISLVPHSGLSVGSKIHIYDPVWDEFTGALISFAFEVLERFREKIDGHRVMKWKPVPLAFGINLRKAGTEDGEAGDQA
jgi:hypothetical protein